MPTSSENPDKPQGPRRPSRISVILLAAVLVALAALVASFYFPRLRLSPAPLVAYAPGCIITKSRFVPTDFTEIPIPSVSALPTESRERALRAVNFTQCPCGCGVSLAGCVVQRRDCPVSPGLVKKAVALATASPH